MEERKRKVRNGLREREKNGREDKEREEEEKDFGHKKIISFNI